MHIAMFMDYHPGSLGGVQTAVAALRRGLERAGHRVTLFTAPAAGAEADLDVVELHGLSGPGVNGFEVVAPNRRNAELIDSVFAARGPVDVVHTHTTYGAAICGMKAARRHGIPLVHTAQSRDDAFIAANSPAPYLVALVMRALHGRYVPHAHHMPRVEESRAARHAWWTIAGQAEVADRVLAPTRHFADLLAAHGVTRPVRVVSNGVDDVLLEGLAAPEHAEARPEPGEAHTESGEAHTESGEAHTESGEAQPEPGEARAELAAVEVNAAVARPEYPGAEPDADAAAADSAEVGAHHAAVQRESALLRLVWCGRLSAEKRLAEAVEAVRHAPGCRLDVYGDGELSESVAALVTAGGVADRIRLHGRVTQSECLRAMASADALLFTSDGFDTQGMTLLEAVAVGLPIVYCDPALAESIPAGGGIRSADPTPAALAETLAKLAADRGRLAEMREVVRAHSASVRQSHYTEMVLEEYRMAGQTLSPDAGRLPRTLAEVPTAPGALPVVGHSLRALRDAPGFVTSLSALGPIVRIKFGFKTGYVLTTPELLREVQLSDAEFEREDLREAIQEFAGNSVNVLRGAEHRQRRRMIAPALKQSRLAHYSEAAADIANKWAAGLPAGVNLMDEAHGLVLDTVSSTLFTADFGDDARREIRDSIPWLLSQVILRTALPPQIRRLRVIANYRWRTRSRSLQQAVGAVIAEYRRRDEDFNDVVSSLIRHVDTETGETLSDQHITDEAILMLAGGVGSMASLTGWLWHEVMRNPVVAERLYAELDEVVGRDDIRPSHLASLPYLKQTVAETIRFWGPWISAANTSGDLPIGDLVIPDGSAIMFSPYGVQHDPRYFPDPDAFDPDRWSPENATEAAKHASLSFGVGRRRCLGDHFAMLEIALATAALLTRWRPVPDPGYRVRASNKDFVLSPSALPVTLHRR
ncbi:cytochrome P450 [Nocardia yamanashiensis]|uniref:cytochrome P450 n=1 Tax=Nocardia yamanashiensis TaxID=209247 RepID=UPI001E2CBA27|nr:cytochrome P450 [Nocardia yamanashiensis]UGT45234.1 cytochrome P450 [Nocardia yamanashiensis]